MYTDEQMSKLRLRVQQVVFPMKYIRLLNPIMRLDAVDLMNEPKYLEALPYLNKLLS